MQSTGVLSVIAPIPSLVRWGLSPDVDLVYRTLCACGARATGDLMRELGMARHRVCDALDSLHAVGAISRSAGTRPGNGEWSAKPPEKLLAVLTRHRPQAEPGVEVEGRQRKQSAVLAQAGVVEFGDGLMHLVTREATRRRLAGLTAVARHEYLASNPEPVFDAAAAQAAEPIDRMLADRGVRVRALGVRSGAPAATSAWREPNRGALAYREAVAVSMKLIVIDRKVALFPVDPLNYERGYLEIAQPPVVQALAASFEREWAGAHDPGEADMPQIPLSPREEALIALLTNGNTDSGAARQLRISERSVSNMVRSLMDRLGVENRFQLGVALGMLHAAPPPPGLVAMKPPATVEPEGSPDEK